MFSAANLQRVLVTLFLMSFFVYCLPSSAATSNTTINRTYTSVAGPGAVAATVSSPRQIGYCFATTQPSATSVCHVLNPGDTVPLSAMGSGVYMWVKALDVDSTVAVVTLGTDATIANGSGGGGGGGDASAANQVIGNTSLSTIATNTTGAATAAKQPSLGTAGTPSSNVITVQGITSMTALKVDNSAVTQPISASSLPLPTGAATNAGITGASSKTLTDINTTLGTPLQAGGNVVVTSAPTTAVTNAGLSNLDVALSTRLKPADTLAAVTTVGTITNPVAVTGTFWQETQPVSGTVTITPSGTQTVSGTVAATQSGTFTVQPGNTANTTPWLVTNSPSATGVAGNSPSQCESTAYEASHACKASAGTIYRIVVYNSKTSAQFIQLFNSTTVPADTTAPITAPMNCPASSNCTYDFGTFGYALSTGISVSNSSTGPTKTIGASDVWFSVAYK